MVTGQKGKIEQQLTERKAKLANTQICSRTWLGVSLLFSLNMINSVLSRSSHAPSTLSWVYLRSHFRPSPALIFYASFPRASVGPALRTLPLTRCRPSQLAVRSDATGAFLPALFVPSCATYRHWEGFPQADMAAQWLAARAGVWRQQQQSSRFDGSIMLIRSQTRMAQCFLTSEESSAQTRNFERGWRKWYLDVIFFKYSIQYATDMYQ